MKAYLDTSVILRRILDQPEPLPEWGRWDKGFTSDLTRVEGMRAIDRLRLEGLLDDAATADRRVLFGRALDFSELIAVGPAVLERAAQSFPTAVGALDAIHLATALLQAEELEERLVFLTHDRRLALAARALGLEVRGAAS